MAVLIRYALANVVGVGSTVIEYEAGKVFDVFKATKVTTPQSKPAGDAGFMVDGEKEKILMEALDKSPLVYRAGGEATTGSAGVSSD